MSYPVTFRLVAADPILRATTGTGEVWDDPSEDLLFMLFEDFQDADPSQCFFLIERTEPGREDQYLRVKLRPDGTYTVEGPDAQGVIAALSMRGAHEAVTRWAFDLPNWRDPLRRPPEFYE